MKLTVQIISGEKKWIMDLEIPLTEEEYHARLAANPVMEVDGKKYRLVRDGNNYKAELMPDGQQLLPE